MTRSPRPVILFGILLGIVYLLHTVWLNCVVEDAFITFRFAKNLAFGHGFVWNVGEPPVEGYTNFLWVLLCGLAVKLRLDVPLFAQILGVSAGLGTMLYTYRYARDLLNLSPGLAGIPCLLLATSGPFATWAASGMEMSLFGLLVVAGLYHLSRAWRAESIAGMSIASAIFFLATLTRPEGLLVFVVIAGLTYWFRPPARALPRHRLLLPLLVYVVPFAIYFTWRYATFGYPLPNTFYAKTSASWQMPVRGLAYAGYFFIHYIGPLLPLLLLAVWDKGWPKLAFGRPALARLPLVTCLSVIIVYSAYIIAVGADYMHMYRFFVPILPLIYLMVGLVCQALFVHLPASSSKRSLVHACIAFAVGATLIHSTPVDALLFSKPKGQHGHYEGVENERRDVRVLTAAGRFFDSYKRSREESLATMVIGAISYFADMKVQDMLGLTDVRIAHQAPAPRKNLFGLSGHEKFDLLYTARRRPTYIIVKLDPQPGGFPNWGGEVDKILKTEYELRRVLLREPSPEESTWVTFVQLKRGRLEGR